MFTGFQGTMSVQPTNVHVESDYSDSVNFMNNMYKRYFQTKSVNLWRLLSNLIFDALITGTQTGTYITTHIAFARNFNTALSNMERWHCSPSWCSISDPMPNAMGWWHCELLQKFFSYRVCQLLENIPSVFLYRSYAAQASTYVADIPNQLIVATWSCSKRWHN